MIWLTDLVKYLLNKQHGVFTAASMRSTGGINKILQVPIPWLEITRDTSVTLTRSDTLKSGQSARSETHFSESVSQSCTQLVTVCTTIPPPPLFKTRRDAFIHKQ